MVIRPPALGRGLGALIPGGGAPAGAAPAIATSASVVEIELSRITPNEYQPRRTFKDGPLNDLAESIKSVGVIQPVIVRRKPEGGYELIAGERRFRASGLAGLTKIPAIIKEAAAAEAFETALIENIQREDLNPIETAEAYDRLMREFGLTQESLSTRLGKERPTIANFLRLLTLPGEIKRDIAEGTLSMGHAKAILVLDNAQKQLHVWREIVTRNLSVREAENLAKRIRAGGRIVVRKKEKMKHPQVLLLEDALRKRFGTKVTISPRGNRGTVSFEYYSHEELDGLLELLHSCVKK